MSKKFDQNKVVFQLLRTIERGKPQIFSKNGKSLFGKNMKVRMMTNSAIHGGGENELY